MAMTLANEGKVKSLDDVKASVDMLLFKVSHEPIDADVLATYTAIVANFSGYSTDTASFAATTIVADVATTVSEVLNFTHDGGGTANTIYGFYGFLGSDPRIFASSFTAKTFDSGGDRFNPRLTVTLDQGT